MVAPSDVEMRFERRHSSVHLEPLTMQLPGSAEQFKFDSKAVAPAKVEINTWRTASTSDDSQPSSPHFRTLAPVKPPPVRNLQKNEIRSRASSSDNKMPNNRDRRHSLIAQLFDDHPNAPGTRRPRRISVSDEFATTAQFIENLRQELMKQM
ncbi:unnamed protein product, partial [Mesorhabditis spiculigera]